MLDNLATLMTTPQLQLTVSNYGNQTFHPGLFLVVQPGTGQINANLGIPYEAPAAGPVVVAFRIRRGVDALHNYLSYIPLSSSTDEPSVSSETYIEQNGLHPNYSLTLSNCTSRISLLCRFQNNNVCCIVSYYGTRHHDHKQHHHLWWRITPL